MPEPMTTPTALREALAVVEAACQDLDDFNEVESTMRAFRIVQAAADAGATATARVAALTDDHAALSELYDALQSVAEQAEARVAALEGALLDIQRRSAQRSIYEIAACALLQPAPAAAKETP